MTKKFPLTKEQLDACARLKELWSNVKRDRRLTQGKVADMMGVTQGAVSHNLNGRTPISLKALAAWSRILGVAPSQIDPILAEQLACSPIREEGRGMNIREVRAKMDPARVERNRAAAARDVKKLHVAWLRESADKTQAEVARLLGISQAEVSEIEAHADLLISTLRKHVEDVHGSVHIIVKLPGGQFTFDNLAEALRLAQTEVPNAND